jgi:protein-tyrosine-phosphatase/DNA-binding transcriptional ArsR family regulator
LGELATGDRQVRELVAALGRPQSLVSYHLGRLRSVGLVSMRRSSADRRQAYYSVDLVRFGELLELSGAALHPGLASPAESTAARRSPEPAAVLFLCTGNSARSQMAEALLEQRADGVARAWSAGSHPKPLHTNAVRVMRERGVDLSGWRSKDLSEFAERQLDYVITLCDRVREVCPGFPGPPQSIHWSIPDPSIGAGTDEESYPAFVRTADELETRIHFLLRQIEHERRRAPDGVRTRPRLGRT